MTGWASSSHSLRARFPQSSQPICLPRPQLRRAGQSATRSLCRCTRPSSRRPLERPTEPPFNCLRFSRLLWEVEIRKQIKLSDGLQLRTRQRPRYPQTGFSGSNIRSCPEQRPSIVGVPDEGHSADQQPPRACHGRRAVGPAGLRSLGHAPRSSARRCGEETHQPTPRRRNVSSIDRRVCAQSQRALVRCMMWSMFCRRSVHHHQGSRITALPPPSSRQRPASVAAHISLAHHSRSAPQGSILHAT